MKFKLAILGLMMMTMTASKASAVIIDGYGNIVNVPPVRSEDPWERWQQSAQRSWSNYQQKYQQERHANPQFRSLPGIAGEFVDEIDRSFSIVDFLFGGWK